MKSLKWFTTALILFICTALISCNKSDGGGDGEEIFIPDLSQNWVNKSDASNKFFFLTDTTHVNHTIFTLNENPDINVSTQIHAFGSFTNHHIEFTYDNNSGTKSEKSYSGTINDASNEITLTSSTLGNLVLQKQ